MIHTVYSNSYEVLRTVFLHNLEALHTDVHADDMFRTAFTKIPVIIPSKAIQDDLRLAIAQKDAICAGWEFMPLSRWMGFFSKEPLTNVVGNEAEWMIRRILMETGPNSFRAQHPRIAKYMDGKTDFEIYMLARHIAAIFVTYSTYRADWLFRWLGISTELVEDTPQSAQEAATLAASPDYAWQVDLWQRLGRNPHWKGRAFLETFTDTLERIQTSKGEKAVTLADGRQVAMPQALHIFVPFVVPPLMLPILKAYAKSGRDVWFYLLNPCAEYWFDLMPRGVCRWSNPDAHKETVFPLLVDNALSTRANIDRLWRFTATSDAPIVLDDARVTQLTADEVDDPQTQWAIEHIDARAFNAKDYAGRVQELTLDEPAETMNLYLEANDERLLRRVQDAVLNLQPDLKATADGAPLDFNDKSIRFFNAPTPTRELQAVADTVATLFNEDETLKPSDVLIAMPDIDAAAPLIEKVFGSLPRERRIPWRISGRMPVQTDTPAQALKALEALMTGRATREAFEAWIQLPAVMNRYGLSSDDLDCLANWLRAAGYRYGLSDEHLDAIDATVFANDKQMNLARTVERLTLGLLFPSDEGLPVADALPVLGTEAGGFVSVDQMPWLLTTLAGIAETLEAFRRRIATVQTPDVWCVWVTEAMSAFFADDERAGQVRTAVWELAEDINLSSPGGTPETVSFEIFMRALFDRLDGGMAGASPGASLTFAPLSGLRGLPYRVIILCGMNDDCAFPGSGRREEYDLMAVAPRRGDRDSRCDNRNTFLDLLLAAREKFMVTYVSGTDKAADSREPSIVVKELRDWLIDQADDPEAAARALTVKLPLNGFSKDSFTGGDWWSSHDPAMLDAVQEAVAHDYNAPADPFIEPNTLLAADKKHRVQLRDIKNFLDHPSRWVLRQIGLRFSDLRDEDGDGILPDASGLAAWQRKDAVVNSLLDGESSASVTHRWLADPRIGAVAVRQWAAGQDLAAAQGMYDLLQEASRLDQPHAPVNVQLTCGSKHPVQVTARIDGVYETPSGEWIVRRATPSQPHRSIERLLEYLCARAAGHELSYQLIYCDSKGKDKNKASFYTFPSITADNAAAVLDKILDAYSAARVRPLIERADSDGSEQSFADERADAAVFRGRDYHGACRRTKAFKDAWKKMFDQTDEAPFTDILLNGLDY